MGVYPEPALCADDVCRLAPSDASGFAFRALRQTVTKRTRSLRSGRLWHDVLTVMVVAATFCSGAATARETAPSGLFARSDQRSAETSSEWGGAKPLHRERAVGTIIDGSAADLSKPKPATAESVVRFGEKSVPRPLVEQIVRAAEATGVDPVYMMALADKESSFDTDVKNPASSAQGLFQFVTGTWLEMVRTYGAKHGLVEEAVSAKSGGVDTRKRVLALRNDPYVASLMAGELIKRDRARIEGRIGRELKTTELYLAHFLGTASAGKFLSLSADEPGKVASSEFRGAAKSNGNVFNAKGRPLTVAEVHERLGDMIDKRITQFEPVKTLAPSSAEAERAPIAPSLDARLRVADPAIPVAQ